jgi:hypothetical protein
MKIVKYLVEVSIEEWKASPHIHKYPYDTMGDVIRVMISKDDYESLFFHPKLGDIVRILEHDAAGNIPEGAVGTVVLDNNDYDGSVLVRFDGWDGGHSGYPDYRFATPETQFSHWWVFNEYLAVVCSADEGKSDE